MHTHIHKISKSKQNVWLSILLYTSKRSREGLHLRPAKTDSQSRGLDRRPSQAIPTSSQQLKPRDATHRHIQHLHTRIQEETGSQPGNSTSFIQAAAFRQNIAATEAAWGDTPAEACQGIHGKGRAEDPSDWLKRWKRVVLKTKSGRKRYRVSTWILTVNLEFLQTAEPAEEFLPAWPDFCGGGHGNFEIEIDKQWCPSMMPLFSNSPCPYLTPVSCSFLFPLRSKRLCYIFTIYFFIFLHLYIYGRECTGVRGSEDSS